MQIFNYKISNKYPAFSAKPKIQSISYNLSSQSQNIKSIVQELTPSLGLIKTTNKDAMNLIRNITNTSVFTKGAVTIGLADSVVELSMPDNYSLSIKEKDQSSKTTKSVTLRNQIIQSLEGFQSISEIESTLKSIFDNIDFPLLKLRLFFKKSENQRFLNIPMQKPTLPDKCVQKTDKIIQTFKEIQEILETISCPGTHSTIKNGYKNIKTGIKGRKQIDFKQIGLNGEDYSVNIVTDRKGGKNLVIIIQKDDKQEYIIVSENKTAYKTKNLSRIYQLGDKSEYYSQDEVNSVTFEYKFDVLQSELEKYKMYLIQKTKKLNQKQDFFNTTEAGVLDKASQKLISDIEKLFERCRVKIHNLKDIPRKESFKRKYNIETQQSNPVLVLKRINNLQENLQLSFPVIKGNKLMKIIVTDSENMPKIGYIIHDNKMVKFDVNHPRKGFREKSKFNYYTQEELEQSGFKETLPLIKQRFERISDL